MSADARYSPSTDAIAARFEDEAVLLHLGTKRYFRLNETAAEVWAALEAGVGDARGLTDWLCERFDVTPEEAGAEVARLLAELEERGLVTAAATS
jgi:PqqD family protein of HPr-rel-A system